MIEIDFTGEQNQLQSSKPKFQDIQTLIISFFSSVAELFIFLVIITKRKLRLKLESWFTLTKSIHSYFVVQILFSFIQGPQDIFPSPGTTVLPNVFYTTYNTALSYLLIAGWICNTVAYLLYMVAAANRKTQYKAAKKAGAESEVIQLY
ncbi:Transmembrane domain-containing protein [Spironucleus salmonicida]|uniref:Transmembrane domain-containing protein n=1 Tax=Spironucleus salmonicida TaxID=348837 RepID=V6LM52_9EUKA|nr:Transmembrane domain-containing protein [Spironucleus salmonicida]|eukprot:EST41789.1 Transmembrane domain-containing protein [Spironucleus salmonicida]